jgi:hypothetical protein
MRKGKLIPWLGERREREKMCSSKKEFRIWASKIAI